MDFLNFDTIRTSIQVPFVESVGKFNDKGINSLFLENISSTAIIFIAAFLGHYLCKIVVKLLNPIKLDIKLESLLTKS